jgi:hypothetical protein
MSKTNNYHTMASFEAQVEHLLDTHPRVLSLEEREILRPNMKQVLLLPRNSTLTWRPMSHNWSRSRLTVCGIIETSAEPQRS